MTLRWAFSALSLRVNTFSPSMTGVAQAGDGFGAERPPTSVSTRHMRQLAAIASLSWYQKRGIGMPALSAAWMIIEPLGAVIIMDETRCMVRSLLRLSYFYYEESCGQCTPCREGTGWMYRMLTRIVDGQATLDDLQMLRAAAGQIEGHTICAFGEAAAWPMQGFLRHFWDEFEYRIVNGRFLVDDERNGTVVQKAVAA